LHWTELGDPFVCRSKEQLRKPFFSDRPRTKPQTKPHWRTKPRKRFCFYY
jgi:hypothetical protein